MRYGGLTLRGTVVINAPSFCGLFFLCRAVTQISIINGFDNKGIDVNKSELIDAIAASADITKADAGRAVDGVISGITGAWVKDQEVVVKDNSISEYRVNLKVTFLLD